MIMTGQNQLWNKFLQNIKFINKLPVVDFETNAILWIQVIVITSY